MNIKRTAFTTGLFGLFALLLGLLIQGWDAVVGLYILLGLLCGFYTSWQHQYDEHMRLQRQAKCEHEFNKCRKCGLVDLLEK